MSQSFHLDIFSLSDCDKDLIEKPPKAEVSQHFSQKYLIKSMIKVSSHESFSNDLCLPSILEFLLKRRKEDVKLLQITNK